ncbi:MAG: superoxide dismutase [Cytophagales bacterium]|nr:superoxide dismutase [Cytophagales bacterium]
MNRRDFLAHSALLGLAGVFMPKTVLAAPKEVFTLPALPYALDALEPHIDKATMEIHHGRHHKAYVDNLNKAVAGTPMEKMSLFELLKDVSKHPVAVRNNGGGHYNHSMFWAIMAAPNTDKPSGELAAAIDKKFGGLDKLKEEMNKAATGRFGSGWAWLIVNNKGELAVTSTPNQDNPLMDVVPEAERGYPVMGVDVWEHAYYLKYQNKRADYLNAWWNVLNWNAIGQRYAEGMKGRKK